MSQVWFKAITKDGMPVNVMGGWDSPLQYFHLTVFYLHACDIPDDNDEGCVWSCMDMPDCFAQADTMKLRRILMEQFGIESPLGFWKTVELKQGNDITKIVPDVYPNDIDPNDVWTSNRTRAKLEEIEQKLAIRLNLSGNIREELTKLDLDQKLVEDSLVADWHMYLATYEYDLKDQCQ